jgi:hypothetical protein
MDGWMDGRVGGWMMGSQASNQRVKCNGQPAKPTSRTNQQQPTLLETHYLPVTYHVHVCGYFEPLPLFPTLRTLPLPNGVLANSNRLGALLSMV